MPKLSGKLPVEDFESLVKESFGSDLQVTHVEWKHLTEPGENFGSLILAVDVTADRNGQSETHNLVIKLPPKSDYLLELFNSPLTFKKELHFYRDVVPAYAALQFETGIQEKDIIDIMPLFYGGRLGLKDPEVFDEQAVIMLENLTGPGFMTQDRIEGLDKAHMDYAIQGLAKLHAITMALKLKKPEFFERVVRPTLVPPANEIALNCVDDMLRKAREDIKAMEEAQPYVESVEKTLKYALEVMKCEKPAEEPWATVVHHDFWVNNMMFRYDTAGNVVDMKIMDFQLTMYDYGTKDLLFFIMSSAKKKVIETSLDDMIEHYYESFLKYLKTFKVDTEKFTKSKFNEHIKYAALIEFEQCIRMVQVIQATRGSASRTEDGKSEASFLNFSGSAKYKEKLLHILYIFDKKGWLLK